LPVWRNDRGLAIDVAVTSPFSSFGMRSKAPADAYALNFKHRKYDAGFVRSGYYFSAMVFETTGGIGEEGISTLKQVFRFASVRQNATHSVYAGRAWARLSCNLQSSVAQGILLRTSAWDPLSPEPEPSGKPQEPEAARDGSESIESEIYKKKSECDREESERKSERREERVSESKSECESEAKQLERRREDSKSESEAKQLETGRREEKVSETQSESECKAKQSGEKSLVEKEREPLCPLGFSPSGRRYGFSPAVASYSCQFRHHASPSRRPRLGPFLQPRARSTLAHPNPAVVSVSLVCSSAWTT
jgi:hypothetical protein